MTQKLNKKDLLNIARGEKPKPPRIWCMLERNENGEVVVFKSKLLQYGEVDIVVLLCASREDSEFFDKLDTSPLVEELRLKLTGLSANDNKFYQFKVTSRDCGHSILKLYNNEKNK
jgi:hypothetical protein